MPAGWLQDPAQRPGLQVRLSAGSGTISSADPNWVCTLRYHWWQAALRPGQGAGYCKGCQERSLIRLTFSHRGCLPAGACTASWPGAGHPSGSSPTAILGPPALQLTSWQPLGTVARLRRQRPSTPCGGSTRPCCRCAVLRRREDLPCVMGAALLDCTQHQPAGLPAKQQSSSLKQHALFMGRHMEAAGLAVMRSAQQVRQLVCRRSGHSGQTSGVCTCGRGTRWAPSTTASTAHLAPQSKMHFACHHDTGLCAASVRCK